MSSSSSSSSSTSDAAVAPVRLPTLEEYREWEAQGQALRAQRVQRTIDKITEALIPRLKNFTTNDDASFDMAADHLIPGDLYQFIQDAMARIIPQLAHSFSCVRLHGSLNVYRFTRIVTKPDAAVVSAVDDNVLLQEPYVVPDEVAPSK